MHVSDLLFFINASMFPLETRAESGHSLWRALLLLAILQGHSSLHRDPSPPRYSIYTYRTARADEDTFDTYSRYRSQPYYNSNNNNAGSVRFPSNSVSSKVPAPSYIASSANQMVIRHHSSCSYDRSHAACTFSLLCYLASGVPVEGCEDNSSMTCCYLNSKGINSGLLSGKGESASRTTTTSSTMYQHYPSPSLEQSPSPPPPLSNAVSSFRSSPTSYNAPVNTISSYYNPSNNFRAVQYQTSDTAPSSSQVSADSNYKLKQDLFAPYEPKSQGVDYYSNAIRRTRTDSFKSPFFQEIANRKLYARNYDVEDICGKPMAKPRSRIIGGQDAYFGEFPWQVHIKITKHQCGGALINSLFVVTAAHCIYQAPMRQLNVIIGAHDIEDPRYQDIPPQYFSVSKVILHPNFRFSASHPDRFDIALIKLDKTVRFSDSVLPVCLPEENIQFEGRNGVVTGWGKTDPALSNRYGTRLLQKVDVPIIDNDKCETWHRTRGIDLRIFGEMMCAGYEDGLKDACVGDSGGPLVIFLNGRWTLAGITSAGFGCAQSRQPGIYHRVSNTVGWIKETVLSETNMR